MRVRTRGKGGGPGRWSSWRRALAISSALHALALLAVGVGATVRREEKPDQHALFGLVPDVGEAPALIDLAIADPAVPPMEVVPAHPEPAVPAVLASGAPGDRTNTASEAPWHPTDGAREQSVPAPDRGAGTGRPVPDRAWRRDASTLHERLTDGAEINQPSRTRTGRHAESPQAVRREQKVGTGDSMRAQRALRPTPAAQFGVQDPDWPGSGADTVAGAPAPALPAPASEAVDEGDRRVAQPAQGPLDAEQGSRSFDVATRGPVAVDDRSARAASNEFHPSVTDLTVAGMSGNSSEGRGPSDTPGAAPLPTRGTAAAPAGLRSTTNGADEEARTRERIYNRYIREVQARVNDALKFPRALAIRLEQGQTIVQFVVMPDGKLSDTVRVVKSAGFTEFDQAALDAVRKASPFPPMRDASRARPLAVTLPVNFPNPVIR